MLDRGTEMGYLASMAFKDLDEHLTSTFAPERPPLAEISAEVPLVAVIPGQPRSWYQDPEKRLAVVVRFLEHRLHRKSKRVWPGTVEERAERVRSLMRSRYGSDSDFDFLMKLLEARFPKGYHNFGLSHLFKRNRNSIKQTFRRLDRVAVEVLPELRGYQLNLQEVFYS